MTFPAPAATLTIPQKTKLLALARLRGAIGRTPSKARTLSRRRILSQGLRDRSVEVSDYAAAVIEVLGGAGRPLIPDLVQAIRKRPRYSIGEAMVGIGLPAVPALAKLLADPKPRTRRVAAWALGSPRLSRELQRYAASGARGRL